MLPFTAAWSQTLPPLNPKLSGDLYPVHDPCIIKAGDTFYVFCTTPHADQPAQIPWYHSSDLLHWERGGHVFAELPAWARQEVPQTTACWAPDISWFDGQYSLYAAGAGERRWKGPGHVAIVRDDGKDFIIYHAYDAGHDGRPTLRIAPLGWTDDNWPVAFM